MYVLLMVSWQCTLFVESFGRADLLSSGLLSLAAGLAIVTIVRTAAMLSRTGIDKKAHTHTVVDHTFLLIVV